MKKELIIIPIFVLTIVLVMLIPNNDYIKTGKLYVSEIMASNNYTIKDDDGDYSDYIEIYNGYKNSINLSNYHLSDDEYDTKKWTFPDITIKSNEYIIVYASGKNKCDLETRICHTNFKLSKSGEIITLTDSNGNIILNDKQKKALEDILSSFRRYVSKAVDFGTSSLPNTNR